MNNQALFSSKEKIKKLKCCLLQFLFGALMVKQAFFSPVTKYYKGRYYIHVIHFKEASGRFFFHFLEVFKKCIDYIRIFFIHFLEISKFW